ncbi:hypothetical protein NIES2135_21240 [Leptolyngbya boryana NIES-2135]|jgi:hypothetical protein|uniref:Uncharacterized protein n=1 Tax=Leptolyngbya boryana NIES-2135 TaxID=1973484 RepID=A0A1Z4JEY1_LEPBY|nr:MULTISPECIES: hypothetical protein [Leptolyngbya]BAY55301.1 hypothetical protein NIES2135_21240 [Leptolyngbya boryana NIES-2135]MBD2369384.1 hypothetical protein [Leptolyngbya sp. FACHB-161]MBD2375614.1 hypothetical protein [Leptolyngbya sp. FACHB-238]MBD2401713.1 hypothetical protein [Leptolyngbya sp. FACHB-239]MBD2406548.1 hypothetical protein [Leptolyngbya sp. FACHB-402]
MKRRIPDRLTKVDSRVSKIFRRLGFLTTKLYFQPANGAIEPVEIFAHDDKGWSQKNWKTGSEVAGHRHSVKVSADWWMAQGSSHGTYSIQVRDDQPVVPCAVEGDTMTDDGTYVSLDLLELNTVETGVNYQ